MSRPCRRAALAAAWIALVVVGLGSAARLRAEEDGPTKLELSGATKYVDDFEKHVQRAKGQPFPLAYGDKEAIRRVKDLHDRFPDHPEVQALWERARQALLASKGETMEVPEDVAAYRQNEQKLKALFWEKAEKVWSDLLESVKGEMAVETPFPAPSHREVDGDTLFDRYVLLDEFRYPANEFMAFQGQYAFVGSGARGFYYVSLHDRGWRGAYEALRRYRRLVNRDLPEDGAWTVLGRITSLEFMIPQAGETKTESAHWGWSVEPVALMVPGCTVALADGRHELGGTFAGEAECEDIKSALYTVTSIPDDVSPERLTEIYVTAIKEKNYPLFLDCINPDRRRTPTALSRIGYHWDLHQDRFATFYVNVTVGEAQVRVLKGFDPDSDDIENALLTPEEKEELERRAGPLLEEGFLWTRAWDERGVQYGSPKPRFFRRLEKGRWYIENYAQPF